MFRRSYVPGPGAKSAPLGPQLKRSVRPAVKKERIMCRLCETKIDEIWGKINVNQEFTTPDRVVGRKYSLEDIGPTEIRIRPQNININKKAFVSTVHYLLENKHISNNPININSNNDLIMAGPICKVSRAENGGIRCINYIIPILHLYGIVEIYSGRPNKTWLISAEEIDV